MTGPGNTASGRRSAGDAIRAVLVPVVLFGVAGVLASDIWRFTSPVGLPPHVPAWATDPATVRQPALRPEIVVAGYTYRCSDCHDLFPSPPETTRSLTQHRHIILKHGINARCFNCHHLTNRDALVDDWGHEIPYDQPQLVCAKCHGPVYRDWLHGSHGRTSGYWDTQRGSQERPTCTRCHDPHIPPFPPMPPAPGPHTLRMGDQAPHAQPWETDPLRVYRRGPGSAAEADTPGDATTDALSDKEPPESTKPAPGGHSRGADR